MTKEQTIKVLELLNAFYAGGKNNAKQQAIAWHLILEKFDFEDAMNAVLRFAEKDKRDYATFPAVGKIVDEIGREMVRKDALVREIISSVQYGRDYELLTQAARKLIPEESYNKWLAVDPEEFVNKADAYADFLRKRKAKMMIEHKEKTDET